VTSSADVCIVGAGPYGLSLAAHLQDAGTPIRIFGRPMDTWRQHMPKSMLLKSDGFASNLSSPKPDSTLCAFCASRGLPYHDTHLPVPIETFIDYGLAFQKQFVPELDPRTITQIQCVDNGFSLRTEDGEEIVARRVVLAVGIRDFAWSPPQFASLPNKFLTHSSQHRDVSAFHGKDVTVIGGGASAIDLAAALHEAGAKVCIVARRPAIHFHTPPAPGSRSLWQRIRHPTSGLGPGWHSRLYTEFPHLFRYLPASARLKIVREHLGPAPGWPMRERVEGKISMYLGTRNFEITLQGDRAMTIFLDAEGHRIERATDHIILATGYRPDIDRLEFLASAIRRQLRTFNQAPVLSAHFESSVPGLYFVGLASVNSFGPMMRFAYGADWTARRLATHLRR
jgi:cation diffusion facilitator CzcD-associated flavoprotein CzcO